VSKFLKKFSTLGPIGYCPASGTIASIATIPLIIGLSVLPLLYTIVSVCIFFGGIFAIQKTISNFESSDPSEIVIDEVMGIFITFFMIPLTIKTMIVGFALFRLFDISKSCGVKWWEQFNGPWGIMLDDMWAGVLSNIIVHMLFAVGAF